MKAFRISTTLCFAASLLAAALVWNAPARAEDGYGSVSGQFVLDGEVPEPKYIIKDGKLVSTGAPPKDPEACAAKNLESDELVIDEKTKGIANVFVYLRKAPDEIHPDLKKPAKDELVFDQKNCRFMPHAMFVRTDQKVLVKSDDPVTHNTHTYPIRNQAENFSLAPNFRKGIPLTFEGAEFLPIKVGCDIHPWMNAYWLILDHPYAAVSGKDGKFTIEKLPEGDYEFSVWHEKAGWVDAAGPRGKLKVTVDGDVKLDPIQVPLDEFEG